MTQEELLDTLDIVGKRTLDNTNLVVETNDSNLYSNWYTILDKSDLVELSPTETKLDINDVSLTFFNDTYSLVLQGDLENNVYKLVVEEL